MQEGWEWGCGDSTFNSLESQLFAGAEWQYNTQLGGIEIYIMHSLAPFQDLINLFLIWTKSPLIQMIFLVKCVMFHAC